MSLDSINSSLHESSSFSAEMYNSQIRKNASTAIYLEFEEKFIKANSEK